MTRGRRVLKSTVSEVGNVVGGCIPVFLLLINLVSLRWCYNRGCSVQSYIHRPRKYNSACYSDIAMIKRHTRVFHSGNLPLHTERNTIGAQQLDANMSEPRSITDQILDKKSAAKACPTGLIMTVWKRPHWWDVFKMPRDTDVGRSSAFINP